MGRIVLVSVLVGLALFVGPGRGALAQDNLLRFEPSPKYVAPGAPSFTVDVWVEDVTTRDPCPWNSSGPCGLGAYKFKVSFDPSVVEWVSTEDGGFFAGYRAIDHCENAPGHDPQNGVIAFQCVTRGDFEFLGPVGSGLLSIITFASLTEGTTSLVFEQTILAEIDGTPIPTSSQDGSVIVAPHADLLIEKTAPPTVTAPGNIVYGLQVTNQGPSEAESVTVVDTLSSNVDFVSADARCTNDPPGSATVTCDLGNMAELAVDNVDITVSVQANKAGRTITNLAAVSSTTLEPDASNNDAQASTTVDLANVDIVKTGPDEVEKGATDTYEIVVSSTGPSAADTTVFDLLPEDVDFVGHTTTQGICYYSPIQRLVSCSLDDVAPSTSATITITVTFPDFDGFACNQAEAQWFQVPLGTALSETLCTAVGQADSDGDGCVDVLEEWYERNPLDPWDFFDVPVPALPDPTPNGPRNKVIDIGDTLAVLFYTFADDNGPPNSNGVDYDSLKDGDWSGPTPIHPDGVVDSWDEVGLRYDRTAEPPFTGPPNGVIDIGDVLAALNQFGHDCSQPP